MIRHGLLLFEDTPEGARLSQRRVAGLSLLERGIRTMARTGLERLTVILPATVSPCLSRITQKLNLTIELLTWDSLASLTFSATQDLLVLLGDHVHHHASLTDLVAQGLNGCALIAQSAEATASQGCFQQIVSSDSGIFFKATPQPSSPVSTGAFLCSAALFEAAALADGKTNFHALLQARAAGRPTGTHLSAPPLWGRITDRRSARRAKNMLFSQVTKPTSGFISRHLNARISIPISKVLVETGLSPHLITVFFVLTTGLASAVLVAQADQYGKLALAGLLWQLAAILDRCDGEVARVKLCESSFGAWFDTVTDNISYIFAYLGMLVGMRRLHPHSPLYSYPGLSAIAALLLTLFVLYAYARKTGSGSLQHYLRDLTRELPDSEKGWMQRFMQRYGFISKRDFFSFFIFISTLINLLELAYWFLVVVLHLAAVLVVCSQSKMLRRATYKKTAQPSTASPREPTLGRTPARDPQ